MTAAPSCSGLDADGSVGFDEPIPEDPVIEAGLTKADSFLLSHDIRSAQDAFVNLTSLRPEAANAQIGSALTRLLLLPEHTEAQALYTLIGGQTMDAQEALYSDDGLLALYARQVDQLEIEEEYDRVLPFTLAELEDPSLLAAQLNPNLSINLVFDQLLRLVIEIDEIATAMEQGLNNDRFERFDFPQGTFHGRTFLGLRRSEVHALAGVCRLAIAASLWAGAYDWPMTAGQLSADVPLQDRLDAFNKDVFTNIKAPERLVLAEGQLSKALEHFQSAIIEGVFSDIPGSLNWKALDGPEIEGLTAFLGDLILSLQGPTPITTNEPIEANLKALFENRTLTQEDNLLLPPNDNTPDTHINYNALEALLLEGILTPYCPLDPNAQNPTCPAFFSEGPATAWPKALENLDQSFANDYGW